MWWGTYSFNLVFFQNRYLFDMFTSFLEQKKFESVFASPYPYVATKVRKILVLGSGGLSIGMCTNNYGGYAK